MPQVSPSSFKDLFVRVLIGAAFLISWIELACTVPSAAARRLTVVVNGSIKRAERDFQLLTSDPQLKPLFGKLSPGVQEAIKLVCDVSVAEFRDEIRSNLTLNRSMQRRLSASWRPPT